MGNSGTATEAGIVKMENGQPWYSHRNWRSENGKWANPGTATETGRVKWKMGTPPPRSFCEECENKRLGAYVTWKNLRNFVARRFLRISRMGYTHPGQFVWLSKEKSYRI